ncbi:TonB-dependent siderophore receptor [Thalassospira profundimaris]|uniref:TonB-dependent receptor n=1 Tax=Thalassospira profundimaris TaxID=502049 RepID=UPI0015F093CA|nr:TonB-dependent siderophore receptor [Thalassospira profundimaris]
MRFTGQKLSSTLLLGTAIALVFAAPNFARAQSTNDTTSSETENTGSTETPAIVIEADSKAEPGDPTPPVYAGGQVATGGRAGVLGNKDVMDTPFSTTSYTSELITNQQAQDVADVLLNDPSVVNSTGYGNFADRFNIRGYDLQSDDISLDGVSGTAPRQKAIIETYERVELLKGASAFLNGMPPGSSGIGGTVNLVPKRATANPVTSLTGSTENGKTFGSHVDIGRRFGSADQFGARANAVYRDGETSIDDEEVTARLASLALDFNGENARVTVDGIINQHYISQARPSVNIGSALTSIPNAPSASHNYASAWTYSDLEDYIGQVRGEYDLTDSTMAYVVLGGRNSEEEGGYATPTLNSSDGTASFGSSVINFQNTDLSSMAGIRQKFETGPVNHEVNLGISGIWQKNYQAYEFYSSQTGSIYGSGADSHSSTVTFTGGNLNDLPLSSKNTFVSYYIADTMGFLNDRIELTAGIRHQEVNTKGYNLGTGAQNSYYDSRADSPMFAIVGKVTNEWSVYANYIEGLSKGKTVTDTGAANFGSVLAPYVSKQFETGVKADFGTFGGGIALFQIEKPSVYKDSTTNIEDTNGEQQNRGIEFTAFGEPVEGFRLLGGLTYIDSELQDTDNRTNDGKRAKGVAEYQATFSVEYDLPFLRGATLTSRVIHSGPQFVDDENTLQLDEWTRLDVGGRYNTTLYGYPVTFRGNIENLTNNNYWASASTDSEYITMGAPLTAKLALTANF